LNEYYHSSNLKKNKELKIITSIIDLNRGELFISVFFVIFDSHIMEFLIRVV